MEISNSDLYLVPPCMHKGTSEVNFLSLAPVKTTEPLTDAVLKAAEGRSPRCVQCFEIVRTLETAFPQPKYYLFKDIMSRIDRHGFSLAALLSQSLVFSRLHCTGSESHTL